MKRNRRFPLFIIYYSFYIALLLACAKTPQNKDIIFNKQAEITIFTSDTTSVTFDVELATTDAQRAQGLMYRYSLEPMQGMFFIFARPQYQSFWMKNTYLSLDMIFIDEEYQIVDIHENAFPLSETQIISDTLSKYVLEILGGSCKKHNIKIGNKVTVQNTSNAVGL